MPPTRPLQTGGDQARAGQTKSGRAIDRLSERATRLLAGRTSRRGLLARLGAWSAMAPVLPILPVRRALAADAAAKPPTPFAAAAQAGDDTKCNYWRYCALDGYLCSACGGGVHSCPPGTEASPTSWIGTCFNPIDSRSYLVAYRDCCGQDACGQMNCLGTDGDTPAYRPQSNNDIIWCYGAKSLMYNCSTAAIVGLAG